mgnify:CR=1 FL=1
MKKKAIFNWSGGKDSALALYRMQSNKEIEIKYLITTISQSNSRISMHGVRNELLRAQAERLGMELREIILPDTASLEDYNAVMDESFRRFREEEIEYSIFGDINLEDLRQYREERLALAGVKAMFPLWQEPTDKLVREFIGLGFKTVVACVNEKYLDKSFAGRVIDEQFLKDLPANVDPCGENGEFHSFVFDGPIFSKPVPYENGELVFKEYKPELKDDSDTTYNGVHDTRFWYSDIILKG